MTRAAVLMSRTELLQLVVILQSLSFLTLTHAGLTVLVEPLDEDSFYDYTEIGENGSPRDGWIYSAGTYGVLNWGNLYITCNSTARQSPVNIDPATVVLDDSLDEINLVGASGTKDNSITLSNNGHTALLSFEDTAIRISGGNLGSSFRVMSAHFHWGSKDTVGSEHMVAGQQLSAEMHIVSYDETRFDSLAAALVGPNSVAVLAVLFTISAVDNPALQPIIANLKKIKVDDTSATICGSPCADVQMLNSLLPSNTKNYYRYLGSLTTPPCSEVVVWTVFSSRQTISSSQLKQFRTLQQEAWNTNISAVSSAVAPVRYLTHNWRPIQPLNGRTVRTSCLHCDSSLINGQTTIVRQRAFSLCGTIVISYIATWVLEKLNCF